MSQLQSIVRFKEAYIGGILTDGEATTTITDIRVRKTGTNGQFFEAIGKDFTCGSGVEYLTITDAQTDRITFKGFSDHIWSIRKK